MVRLKSMFRMKKRNEEGQGTVEFALILPILLIVIFGIVDFGWLFFNITTISNITRSSARKAIVSLHEYAEVTPEGEPVTNSITKEVEFNETKFKDELTKKIKNGLPAYLKNSNANLTVTVKEENTASTIKNKMIKVTVEAKIPLFTPVLSSIVKSKYYTVRRTVTMRREY